VANERLPEFRVLAQLPNLPRQLRSTQVLVRFCLRTSTLVIFAAFGSIGFGRSLAALLWMAIILSAVVGLMRREPPAEQPAKVTAEFRPLDGDIVNEAIPAFFIGRNMEGFWLARDAKGQLGGIFLLENSAVSFARRNSRPAGCATIFPSERFELDLENKGNPLVEPLMRLKRKCRQLVAFIGKMTEGIKGFR
jgi:hypothetical protein